MRTTDLNKDLKWSTQVSKVYTKSTSIAFTIIRTFNNQNPQIYTQLFKTYVRSIIEYNSSIWNLNLIKDIRKIESIQIQFTQKLCQKLNIKYSSYNHRLKILNLETLEIRRLKSDLKLVYKIHNNLINLNINEFFTQSTLDNSYNLRRHDKYLKLPDLCKTTIRRSFFSLRIVKIWNKLPQYVIRSKSLPIFKDNLDSLELADFAELVY